MEVNSGGTVTLYMGPKAPKGNDANWIPTAEGQKYYMLFRFYGADNAVFTKSWQLNDLDNQLFDNFVAAKMLLKQDPVQADSRDDGHGSGACESRP